MQSISLPNTRISLKSHSSYPLPLLLVCGYMSLVILRPWESIRYLEGVRIEFPFALLTIGVALFAGKLRIVSSPTNKWVYGLVALHFLLAPFAFNSTFALDQGIFYAKLAVLYLLMLSVAEDERALKLLVTVFVFAMILYTLHSFWEYTNGRHVYRMGIVRMIGVGTFLNDPNAFGASLVLSFPFVYALLRTERLKALRLLYLGYGALAVYCIVLTGSRSASMAFVLLLLTWALLQKGKTKLLALGVILLAIGSLWTFMPEDKQIRIQTLWDDDVGMASAHESADGRKLGWKVSWEMFKREPLTGVGAGGMNYIGYKIENRIEELFDHPPTMSQSHVLYGQVLAEQGIFGAILFTGLVLSIGRSALLARRLAHRQETSPGFPHQLSGAILISLLLLLFLGIGGHNFYRPLWLWLAAWSGALLSIVLRGHDAKACGH